MIRSHLDPFSAKVLAVVATILIFAADWWTPPSINISLFFGCVIVLIAWSGSLRWLWIYALTSAVLSFVALYGGPHTPIDTTNRYITVGMLAVIAGFVHFSIVLANRSLIEVAQREQAEESLRKSQAELAHAGRVTMMGELGSSIAHEITQPLSGIMMNSNASLRWLSADPPDLDEAREAIRRIVRDGNLANGVIQRIRKLLQKATVEKTDLSINEVVQETVGLTQNELDRKNVVLRTELSRDLPPIKGDRVQLQQVLLNLILNGADSMVQISDRRRELTIRTQAQDDGKVLVSVRDSGTGFGDADPDKVFDPFYTTKKEGMGMGLAISRSIISDHEGRLWATENDGPGATFQFAI